MAGGRLRGIPDQIQQCLPQQCFVPGNLGKIAFDTYSHIRVRVTNLRSQPLDDQAVYRIVVYPATSAYLATVTVLGRERISVHAGSYNAIKFDVQLKRVGKNLELEPHRKFRRATVWVSDDENRIPLRIEAQIFSYSVFSLRPGFCTFS